MQEESLRELQDRVLHEIAEDYKVNDMSVESRLAAMGLCLAACGRKELTEQEYRDWLLVFDLNYIDPVIEMSAKLYINIFAASDILYIICPCEDTWIDTSSPVAFESKYNHFFAEEVERLKYEARMMEALFQ